MAHTEADSFVLKFKNLWHAGVKATLTFQSDNGEAFVTLKAGLGSLPPPPSWNSVLESDATQHQDTFDLLVGQLQEQRRAHPSLADRTLSQLLSNLIAGDQVAAVEEDAQSRTTTKMPTKTTPKGRK